MLNTRDNALVLTCDPKVKRTVLTMPVMVLVAEVVVIWQCIQLKAAGQPWTLLAGFGAFYFVSTAILNSFMILRYQRTLTLDHSGITFKTLTGSKTMRWAEIREFGAVQVGQSKTGEKVYGVYFSRKDLERKNGKPVAPAKTDIGAAVGVSGTRTEIKKVLEYAEKRTMRKPFEPWKQ